MAKKVVAALKKEAKNYVKVIKPVKNEKTGAYAFKEEMVPAEMAKDILSKK